MELDGTTRIYSVYQGINGKKVRQSFPETSPDSPSLTPAEIKEILSRADYLVYRLISGAFGAYQDMWIVYPEPRGNQIIIHNAVEMSSEDLYPDLAKKLEEKKGPGLTIVIQSTKTY